MRAARGGPVLALSFVLAACGADAPTGSPTSTTGATAEPTVEATQPTVSIEPTLEPTQAPEPSAAPGNGAVWAANPPTPILIGSVVRVTVAELNVREEPFTSATGKGTLTQDALIYVETPPVDSDGYIWYRGSVVASDGVMPDLPASIPQLDSDTLFGWFAAGTREVKYVSRVAPRCPDVVNLKNVSAMTGHERLACFGGDWVELEGAFRCYTTCLGHAFGQYAPEWLAHPVSLDFVFAGTTDNYGLMLRFPPDVAKPELGTRIRVRGHMRDAAAETCTMTWNYWWTEEGDAYYPIPDPVAQLICRQAFVVERFEVLETS